MGLFDKLFGKKPDNDKGVDGIHSEKRPEHTSAKVFEDYFSELQADMVSVCLEYVENKAEGIYIYCSCEEGIISSGFFFRINGIVVDRHELNNALPPLSDFRYDTSGERQSGALDIINADIEKLKKLCEEYQKPMPTEMKIVYDIDKNSLEAEYRYDLVYSDDPQKLSDDAEQEWFCEISKNKTSESVPKNSVKPTSLESNLADFYRRAAERVNGLIPVVWDTFYLSIELNDEGGGTAYFFYTLDETGDKLHLSHDIPKDYNVNTPEYMSELKDMLDMGKNMRRVFADEGQEIWYTFAMTVTSHGEMRSEFGYTDWLKSDYPNYELMDYFIYKYIDKKHLNPDAWSKMEEIALYEKTTGPARG